MLAQWNIIEIVIINKTAIMYEIKLQHNK